NDLKKINVFALQSVYLVSEGKDLNEALINNEKTVRKIEELKEKGIVSKYSGVSSLIISDSLQIARIKKWNEYWTPEKKHQLITRLKQEGALLKFKPTAFERFDSWLNKDFQRLDDSTINLFRKTYLDDYITEKPGNTIVVTLARTGLD